MGGAPCRYRMTPRKLPLLLLPLLLFGLMAVALVLVVESGAFTGGATTGGDDAARVAELDADAAGQRSGTRTTKRGMRPGSITGDVRTLDSREPAAGRTVVLVTPDQIVRELSTEANGGFSFGDVPPGGPYELRVEGHDHAPVLRPGIWIAPNQRSTSAHSGSPTACV